MTRRDLLRLLLASPVAALVDVEQLLWTPKPIITVPGWPLALRDEHTGLSIRFVKEFKVGDILLIHHKYDILYGSSDPRTRYLTAEPCR